MSRVIWCAAAVLGVSSAASATGVTVYSNGGGSGDMFTNAGGTNTGQAVGTSGWYYNNVRNNGNVGINSTYARSGNGSVYMETTQGPGGASSKACDAFRAAVGCCVSCVGTFQVRIKDEPTSGSAPSVTTKAPVFLLKVPAP